VAADPEVLTTPMSRNENFQLPLHFAVRKNRPEMVELLLDLGADPTATARASRRRCTQRPDVDRAVIETLTRRGGVDLFGALALVMTKRRPGSSVRTEVSSIRGCCTCWRSAATCAPCAGC
jgi:hypothetical protein